MRTAVDTNVISALWSAEPSANRVSEALDRFRAAGPLLICPPVYAELHAHPNASARFVEEFLASTEIAVDFDLSKEVWEESARRFARYAARRRKAGGGDAKRLLADFLVGAHALLRSDRLLTLDRSVYRRDFPELKQIEP